LRGVAWTTPESALAAFLNIRTRPRSNLEAAPCFNNSRAGVTARIYRYVSVFVVVSIVIVIEVKEVE